MQTRERAHCARSVFPFIKKKKKKTLNPYVKGERTKYKSGTGEPTPGAPKIGMTKKGCVKVGIPVKGVSNGSVGS